MGSWNAQEHIAHGGIRAPVGIVNTFCKEEREGLLIVHLDLEPRTGEYGFRAYMDYGNVLYVQYLLTIPAGIKPSSCSTTKTR